MAIKMVHAGTAPRVEGAAKKQPSWMPGKTFGRSGHQDTPEERLSNRITHLDALMTVLTSPGEDGTTPPFFDLNRQIQEATLDLVRDLAQEIHELHEGIDFPNRAAGQ